MIWKTERTPFDQIMIRLELDAGEGVMKTRIRKDEDQKELDAAADVGDVILMTSAY